MLYTIQLPVCIVYKNCGGAFEYQILNRKSDHSYCGNDVCGAS